MSSKSLVAALAVSILVLTLFKYASAEEGSSSNGQGLEGLLRTLPNDNDETRKDCIICLRPFEGGNGEHSLECNHTFHGHCIQKWLINHETCPVCRAKLSKESMDNLGHQDNRAPPPIPTRSLRSPLRNLPPIPPIPSKSFRVPRGSW